MITTGILSFLYLLISVFVSILPNGIYFSQSIHTAFQAFANYIYIWNYILPITELLSMIQLTVYIASLIFGLKIVIAVYSMIRGGTSPTTK